MGVSQELELSRKRGSLRTVGPPESKLARETLPVVKNHRAGPIAAAMADHEQISPELALVDPALRARGLETLARVEASRVWAPYAPVRLVRPVVPPPRRRPPFLVAASVYLGFTVFQVVIWGLALVSALVVSISAAVLLG
jgi:hypothetical protein